MNELRPMLGYLLPVFPLAVGIALTLSARKIYECHRLLGDRQLAVMKRWNPLYKFSMALRQQISPDFIVFNIRAVGALIILSAAILAAIAISN
jgi:hypothetical protein